jgi:hypothetical protein
MTTAGLLLFAPVTLHIEFIQPDVLDRISALLGGWQGVIQALY